LRPERAVLSDANQELITTYTEIRDDAAHVIARLQGFADNHSPTMFAAMRDDQRQDAARFIYLNKTCFNGLYRVNSAGVFNVPIGSPKTAAQICDAANLLACAAALSAAFIECWDFRQAIAAAVPGDLIYADPPYLPSSKTSDFTAYTPGGFSLKDHQDLADALEAAAQRGVHVLLSSADNPASRRVYKAFRKQRVKARRNINSKGTGRGTVGELLCTYEQPKENKCRRARSRSPRRS
jgi:DNA adenine methylase